MTAASRIPGSFDFDAAEAGASAAAALRTIRFQCETAPAGRFFAAIASLKDISEQAAVEFERAGLAELHAETDAAELHLHRGMRLSQRLKSALGAEVATPLPDFLQRKS
jgi:hypothetical protein